MSWAAFPMPRRRGCGASTCAIISETGANSMTIKLRVASDVGGTFTDLVWYAVDDETGETGAVHAAKVDTTPPDFEDGVMAGLAKAGIDLGTVGFLAHGSTVVINALTE